MTDAERQDMKCQTCAWFRPSKAMKGREPEKFDGECRRNPPQILLLQADTVLMRDVATFPAVYETSWCGEWRGNTLSATEPRAR